MKNVTTANITNNSASSATIVRFPYIHYLTDIDDFLYSNADVAIWSTVETGVGITAACVATLRPLLRTFFGGGSSARGNGTSARQWHRTGSGHPKGDTGFDLHDVSGTKRFGVTTVIDHNNKNDTDIEGQKTKGDNDSDGSGSISGTDNWNNSQSNLAHTLEDLRSGPAGAWNIVVKKSIVQTRG